MKMLTYIFSIIALGFVIYNFTKIDFKDPFESESIIAIITVFAGLCVVLILTILRVSKRIEKLQKRKF